MDELNSLKKHWFEWWRHKWMDSINSKTLIWMVKTHVAELYLWTLARMDTLMLSNATFLAIFRHCVKKRRNFSLNKTWKNSFVVFPLSVASLLPIGFSGSKKPALQLSGMSWREWQQFVRRRRSEKAAPRRATFMEMILAHFHLTFQCLGFIYRSNGFVPKPYLLPSRTIVCYHIINHH